jgi:hypothetical protein
MHDFIVDANGHVPGLAALYPPGYKVFVDAAGNFAGMEPLEGTPLVVEEAQPEQAEVPQSLPELVIPEPVVAMEPQQETQPVPPVQTGSGG